MRKTGIETLLSGSMKIDSWLYQIKFKSDNTCELKVVGLFFHTEKFEGQYIFRDSSSIQFIKKPYDRDGFLPDVLFIDKAQNALFFSPQREKIWGSYFEIRKMNI